MKSKQYKLTSFFKTNDEISKKINLNGELQNKRKTASFESYFNNKPEWKTIEKYKSFNDDESDCKKDESWRKIRKNIITK